jgi:DNA-binding transcriptional LysR family regulator
MRDLNDLALFAAVVANGGFSAAARSLGVPKSRISRRVAALEGELGVRLVERTTRRFKVTEVGQDVFRHAQAVLSEAEAIDEVVARLKAEPQGLVRISCPIGADRLLADALPEFLARHPRLRLQVMVTNRRVDLIEEGFDVAVRVRQQLDTDADLQLKVLGHSGVILVASPAFLAAYGHPEHPSGLSAYPTLGHTDRPGRDRWVLANSAGETIEVTHEPRLSATSFAILRQAAAHGVGVAALPDDVCAVQIESGELVRILPDWETPRGVVHLVFASRRGLLPSVRAVIDFLADALHPLSPAWKYAD